MNDQTRLDRRDKDRTRTAPPPRDFDPLTAGPKDLARYGLPQRPDPQTQPGLAALWERQARRYRAFDHVEAQLPQRTPQQRGTPALAPRLEPTQVCGYTLTSVAAPFTALFVKWTVPNLRYVSSTHGADQFHTFVSLGFLDVHVEMGVDAAENVSARVTVPGVDPVGLPVEPGDLMSGSMCLDTNPPGRATYVLANETRSQTVNFSFDSGYPPAVTVEAGISRGALDDPFNPLARFGAVYFDEISAYTTAGPRSLTSGQAVTMADGNGATLALPERLNDDAFRVVSAG
ncbi:MAG TPA: G1 family glutamic endopeptidase [Segeticoccus sp.]|uniref:G1 family glutamic endopeptidase n=1 Tax=Segeticoccus sp. TaxID=2706531 RepID=UPI002D809FF6|nr:G1 family glutamic endopeptidase [Segeticoccus sp.]HET8599942.1 G1 family glutamic endopeptidase [Segeticoccus sp.]